MNEDASSTEKGWLVTDICVHPWRYLAAFWSGKQHRFQGRVDGSEKLGT